MKKVSDIKAKRKKRRKIVYRLFNGLIIATLLVPTLGLAVHSETSSSEKRDLASFPSLFIDGGLNADLLSEMGAWYDDHFAFRSWLISAYAGLEQSIFKESSIRNVITGNDDWLFYRETLDQYLGENALSDRQIQNIVHNLGLYQYALNSKGIAMRVTIVPNKNTVYPEQMKSRYLQTETKDLDRVGAALSQAGIPYTDLKTPLVQDERTLYYQRDSHWTNEGALLAYNALMDQMGIAHNNYDQAPTQVIEHISDLDEMLNPKNLTPETDQDYSANFTYTVQNEIQDYMDSWIETRNENKPGTLFMFRDSFGEALAPYLADNFGQAYFSRLEPYNLIQMDTLHPDVVVFERAERRMGGFQEQAAIMNMPVVANFEAPVELQNDSSLNVEAQNGWYLISGKIKDLHTDDQIYLQVDLPDQSRFTYPVFYVNDGYQVYLPQNRLPESSTLSIIRVQDGAPAIVDQLVLDGSAIENSSSQK